MENYLKDPYDDTQQRYKNGNTSWPGNGQFSNLDDLQLTVAPASLAAHDPGDYAKSNPPQTDPFLETFDFLGSPTQQAVSPNLAAGGSDAWADPGENVYADMDPLNNLDLLVLPERRPANGGPGHNMLASAQYFSPNSRGANFGQLNSIVEDSVSPSFYNNTFSPQHLRHGSVSIPPPLNSYLLQHLLSPQQNTYDSSFDTLKLPYSGSYLNSPPPAMSLSQSSGTNATLSYVPPASMHLPNTQHCATGPSSVGALPNNQVRKVLEQSATPKQLTLEEKAKRRREFHNAVERRRRDLIKEKIKVLGFLVPPSLLTPQVCAVQTLLKSPALNSKEIKELLSTVRIKDTKPNKAFILQTSVDYIRHLQYVVDRQTARRGELEAAISKLSTSPEPAREEQRDPSVKLEQTFLLSEFDPDEFFSADI